jgi:3-hydroxyisobutyrate dehydrogenase
MVNNNMAPGFYVNHFVKDMGIALGEASRLQIALPGLALAHQLYVALQAQGGGSDGTQSLIRALSSLSGVDWEQRS